ncbi:paraquat-inducible protein A [Vibrio sp. UCD-FRSSP16_10]|uniref:paraquat-inducible protein A n=1 Tax=unclassified Vibrio TaxID=2614977 RepID=UPI0007FC0B96|nr:MULTISPECIES: paraquat-inducible protein A [unclassified Vibrio]OBT12208.1 paraquat-inducible protein A [Vibrio sp. UCD-FRSSP16_30]OBT20539.1 paraquat-inducible protein A [Vibrio sp. UCD-FRSSP16_10]
MAIGNRQINVNSQLRLCQGCGLSVASPTINSNQNAYCPRCNTQLYRGHRHSFSGDVALAVVGLLLFIPVIFAPFLSIRLFGEYISATLLDGVILLVDEGFSFVALLVFFCSFLVPITLCISVISANIALKRNNYSVMRWSLFGIYKLKHWMMIDVYIVSIAICCFKLTDYSDLIFGLSLPVLAVLQLICLALVMRVSPRRYWQQFDDQQNLQRLVAEDLVAEGLVAEDVKAEQLYDCPQCHLIQTHTHQCKRCQQPMKLSASKSLQATWAYLIVASLALIPANVIPISILFTNGARIEDTIYSGVISLINNDMLVIAIIIFIASIVVPVAKILGLLYLLLCIHFKRSVFHRQRMMLFYVVKWIGKWSMVDLFVMSIMLTLVDRGQVLNFTPGFGAVAFGIVVIFTMFATDALDPKLIWKNHTSTLAPSTSTSETFS